MAEPSSWRPEPFDSDGPPRPPTFVQIRPPAAAGPARRKLGILAVGLALAAVLGWAGYRVTGEQDAPVVTQAAPAVTGAATPHQEEVPADLYDKMARRAVDTAVASPAWSRESLIDRVSPFDPSISDRVPSRMPPADTTKATPGGPFEVSVRLGKGDTIGSALQKLGFTADAIADVISALARHVSLKRLPIGLGMTVQVQPSGNEGGKPVLQALTLHPEGRREIKVERDGEGTYAVERRERSSVR
jgi:hypothetical protein